MKLPCLPSLALSVLLAAPALLAVPARGDVVHLTDGRRLEGAVSVEGGAVVVRHRWGQVRVERAEVERIEETDDPWDQLERLRRELAQGTADERYRFAEWARGQGFQDEARKAFLDVLRVDPDHPGARAALGYVLQDGRWITETDRNRALGLVEVDGEWVTPQEKARRLAEKREAREKEREAREAKELAREAERERKQKEREEERAARRERLRLAELELAKARAQAQAEAEAAARRPTRFVIGPDGNYYPLGTYPFGTYRVLGTGGVYYGGCYPYPTAGYGSWGGYRSGWRRGSNAGLSGFYNGGNWGVRFRLGF